MILNLVIVAILMMFAVSGGRKGFISSLFDMLKTVLSLCIVVFLAPFIKRILFKNTNIFESLLNKKDFITFKPEAFKIKVLSPINDLVISIIIFVFLFFIVKFILRIFNSFLSKSKKTSILGAFDRFLGFMLGLLKGLVIVSLLILVILPFIDTLGIYKDIDFKALIEESFLGNLFYNENPLWRLILMFS